MTATSLVPLDLTLTDPEGRPVRLGDLLSGNRFTVVQLVRYFGCLPCQEWCVGFDGEAAHARRLRRRRRRGRRVS